MRSVVWLAVLMVCAGGCARRNAAGPSSLTERVQAANEKFFPSADSGTKASPSPRPLARSTAPAATSLPPPRFVDPFVHPAGRVAAVNDKLRFVVIDFSLSRVPEVEQRLNVYRQGQKTGEVRVSGPTINQNTVADILSGEVQVGDEVRTD
jgi:hypothetical protein